MLPGVGRQAWCVGADRGNAKRGVRIRRGHVRERLKRIEGGWWFGFPGRGGWPDVRLDGRREGRDGCMAMD